MLNKPSGVVSTMSDPEGRPVLRDYVAERNARLFHVGRLDADTEGLILLTNDGELAHRLAHPSYEVRKTYLAEITGPVAARPRQAAQGTASSSRTGWSGSTRSGWSASVGSRVMVEVVAARGPQARRPAACWPRSATR